MKIQKIYNKTKSILLNKSINAWAFVKGTIIIIIGYFAAFIPLYITLRISVDENTKFTSNQWLIIFVGSGIIQIIYSLYDKLRSLRTLKRAGGDYTIFRMIGGLIMELRDIHINTPNRREKYIVELLNSVEKSIDSILRAEGISVGNLCTNLMLMKGNYLEVVEFGTKFFDRDKPKIKFDENNPLPGAPQAWVNKKINYVDDIKSKEFEPFFNTEYKFRSFISVPVIGNGTVIAIINIDSNIEKQFISDRWISKNIEHKIAPFLVLFEFNQELSKFTTINKGIK